MNCNGWYHSASREFKQNLTVHHLTILVELKLVRVVLMAYSHHSQRTMGDAFFIHPAIKLARKGGQSHSFSISEIVVKFL